MVRWSSTLYSEAYSLPYSVNWWSSIVYNIASSFNMIYPMHFSPMHRINTISCRYRAVLCILSYSNPTHGPCSEGNCNHNQHLNEKVAKKISYIHALCHTTKKDVRWYSVNCCYVVSTCILPAECGHLSLPDVWNYIANTSMHMPQGNTRSQAGWLSLLHEELYTIHACDSPACSLLAPYRATLYDLYLPHLVNHVSPLCNQFPC